MIIRIPDLLMPEEVGNLLQLLEEGTFKDGKLTAGWHARLVKKNQQMDSEGAISSQANATITRALLRNKTFVRATQPKKIQPAMFSRYETGMEYGSHVDNALMGAQKNFRTDLSLTIFLNDPKSYEGGDLVIDAPGSEQYVKLEAGSVIIYPSTTLHRVTPVTTGVRTVAVIWVQSIIRRLEHREILYDLDTARRAVFKKEGKSREFDLLTKSHANLMRMWAEV